MSPPVSGSKESGVDAPNQRGSGSAPTRPVSKSTQLTEWIGSAHNLVDIFAFVSPIVFVVQITPQERERSAAGVVRGLDQPREQHRPGVLELLTIRGEVKTPARRALEHNPESSNAIAYAESPYTCRCFRVPQDRKQEIALTARLECGVAVFPLPRIPLDFDDDVEYLLRHRCLHRVERERPHFLESPGPPTDFATQPFTRADELGPCACKTNERARLIKPRCPRAAQMPLECR